MKETVYPKLEERVFRAVCGNGLQLIVVPRPGFAKSYAFFATNYGSMDMRFCLNGSWRETPAGVAHYLDHKMFDTEDGIALQELAQLGAEPNAFTSNAITGYYFESTEHFEKSLRILLSFVSVPYFTAESVAKEQGIIGQEIRMIEDNPEWQVYSNLLRGLYRNHPARIPVAGSVESITGITADMLYDCHRAFYDPSNMALCVVGDVQPGRILQIAEEVLPESAHSTIERDYGEKESDCAAQSAVETEMEVSLPLFLCGYKCAPVEKEENHTRRELIGNMACDVLFGESSPLYNRLYAEGLINGEFGGGYEILPGISFVMAGGESQSPRQVHLAIVEEAERIAREGVEEALYQQVRRATYGSLLRGLNSFEGIAVGSVESAFRGEDYFRFPEAFDSITKADIEAFIRTYIVPDRATISIVHPKEQN
mgnify:FL=1